MAFLTYDQVVARLEHYLHKPGRLEWALQNSLTNALDLCHTYLKAPNSTEEVFKCLSIIIKFTVELSCKKLGSWGNIEPQHSNNFKYWASFIMFKSILNYLVCLFLLRLWHIFHNTSVSSFPTFCLVFKRFCPFYIQWSWMKLCGWTMTMVQRAIELVYVSCYTNTEQNTD